MAKKDSKPYMNPYLAGFLLGLVLLATIYVTGRGLGASGALKSVVIATVNGIAPDHTANTMYYQEYKTAHPEGPMRNWLVFEVLGLIIGAFLSGVISNRVGLKFEKGPSTSSKARIFGAIIGGFIFGYGSQLGRGCTSGSALSGMAVMSFGGILTMLCIFGSGYAFAYFLRKHWLK
jgi:uncharacterized membrane protein YedE/YeeE